MHEGVDPTLPRKASKRYKGITARTVNRHRWTG